LLGLRRVDLKVIMSHEADPRRPLRPFERRPIPDRRDAVVSLLVDLSGSMRGAKIAAAIDGVCLLAETLARLQIPCRIDGFQDELIPLSDPFDGLGPRLRAVLPELVDEVAGVRTGGRNRPSFNDDGTCLLDAARHLLRHPARDKLLIVVSDGRPEGRRSNALDLSCAIRDVAREDIALVGVGLGPGTQHVSDYYPDHLAEVPVERFATRLGQVLSHMLLRRF